MNKTNVRRTLMLFIVKILLFFQIFHRDCQGLYAGKEISYDQIVFDLSCKIIVTYEYGTAYSMVNVPILQYYTVTLPLDRKLSRNEQQIR